MGANTLYRRAASSSYPALPCNLKRGGRCDWGQAGPRDLQMPGNMFRRGVGQWSGASAVLAAPCAFSWLIFLGEDLPIWVWSWQPISSWCLEGTNPKWSPRDWLGGGNAGQLSIVGFFFVVYEITAAPRFFKKHWKCLSFISLIYLKHNAVRGKYCYCMILVTHVVLKISVLCDESNAYVLLWRGFWGKKRHLTHNFCILEDQVLRAICVFVHMFTDWILFEHCCELGAFLDAGNKRAAWCQT